jgi:hypothetical protein
MYPVKETVMVKFQFALKTREGQKVHNIVIMAVDLSDAERKLLQMYRHCVILRCDVLANSTKQRHVASVEDLLH